MIICPISLRLKGSLGSVPRTKHHVANINYQQKSYFALPFKTVFALFCYMFASNFFLSI